MISTREELKNVIELEKKGYSRKSLIRRYLRELRICEYYNNCAGGGITKLLFKLHNHYRNKIGLQLGFEIPLNVFGKGLQADHAGGNQRKGRCVFQPVLEHFPRQGRRIDGAGGVHV